MQAERVEEVLDSVDQFVLDILHDPTPPLFPPIVSVEMTSRCNLQCPMCPHPGLARDKAHMEPDLFRSVVDELAVQPIELFQPQGLGESLLHPKWSELMGHVRRRGVRPIVMITNATLLTEANARRIVELAPDAVVVGVDGDSDETYGEVRYPARLDRTRRNVERLLRLRDRAGVTRGGARDAGRPRVIARMIRMRQNVHEIESVRAHWMEILGPQDRFVVSEVHTWADAVADQSPEAASHRDERNAGERPRGVCRMLLKSLMVQQDGNLTPCCYDVEGELSLGNADRMSLSEAWHGDELARLRELHASGRHAELDVCRRCDAFVV